MKDYQITFSPLALIKVKEHLNKRGTPKAALRLGIKGGSCAGYSYVFQYEDDSAKERDIVFNIEELQVIIDKKSIIYLNGTLIDWEESLMSRGFKFNNPNVITTCGCGSSISFKE